MDHLVETLEEATVQVQGMHHQQVRERGRRIKAAAELGLARSSRGRQWGRALGGRGVVTPPTPEEVASTTGNTRPRSAAPMEVGWDDGEEEEEEVVVEEKVALLRQLVPGGEGMPVEGLLEETAGYIAALKAQVGVMRALARLLSGSGSVSGAGLDALALPEAEPAGVLTTEKPV